MAKGEDEDEEEENNINMKYKVNERRNIITYIYVSFYKLENKYPMNK